MPVDALVLGFIAAGAVFLAIVAAQSISRGRDLESIAGEPGSMTDVSLPPAETRRPEAEDRWSA